MKEDGYYLSVLANASQSIEARHIVASVVRNLVEDVASWDQQCALYQAKLDLEISNHERKVQRNKLDFLEKENARLTAQIADMKARAASVRALLIEDVAGVLGSSRERASLHQKVAFYQDKVALLENELHVIGQRQQQQSALSAALTPPGSPMRISAVAALDSDAACSASGGASTGNDIAVANGTVGDAVMDTGASHATVTAPPAVGAVVAKPSASAYKRPPSILDLEDSTLLSVFSFLTASEVLGIAHICRGTFKRVDKIFGIGSDVIKPDWPDHIITPEEQTMIEAAKTDAAAAERAANSKGISRSTAEKLAEKLDEKEMGAIIRMMDSMRKLDVELKTLRERETGLESSLKEKEAANDFVVNKLRETELALKESMQEMASLRKQGAADAEVVSFMDARGLELEAANESLKLRCERLEAGLDLQRNTHEHVEQRLRDELEESYRALDDLESTYKAQKKVLVKEVKTLRNTVASTTREMHQYKSQVHAIKETLDERLQYN